MASGVTPGDRGTVQSPPVWTDGSDVFVFQSAGPHKTAPREAIPPGQPLENGEHDAVSDHSHDFGERSPLLSPDSDESPAKLESGTPVKPPTSKIGVWAAVLSLVRASIGPGSMALPYAFSQSGIAIGLGMLVVFTVAIFINSKRDPDAFCSPATGSHPDLCSENAGGTETQVGRCGNFGRCG